MPRSKKSIRLHVLTENVRIRSLRIAWQRLNTSLTEMRHAASKIKDIFMARDYVIL